MSVNKRIRRRRVELGMSQGDLAKALGYNSKTSRSTIAKIEAGAVDISSVKLQQFAKALNVSTSYLLGEDEEQNATSFDTLKFSTKISKMYQPHQEPLNELVEFYVNDDGMINSGIKKGDCVFVDIEKTPTNGDVVLASANNTKSIVRRYYKYGDRIFLRPENPSMIELNFPEENVQIVGKVVSAKINL